jgi:hypothetical protein
MCCEKQQLELELVQDWFDSCTNRSWAGLRVLGLVGSISAALLASI